VAEDIEIVVPLVIGPEGGVKMGAATRGNEYVAEAELGPEYPLAIASA